MTDGIDPVAFALKRLVAKCRTSRSAAIRAEARKARQVLADQECARLARGRSEG